ncbi:MAG: cytochrome b/b6 domain-containing protein [Telluria sp.]
MDTKVKQSDTGSAATARPPARVLVWDAPVRVFHWLLVLCFAGAWLTAESEGWEGVHVVLGYTAGGLAAFRVVWGVIGTRYARFTDFVKGPRAIAAYLGSLRRSEPLHYIGHNPAGAVAIVLILALLGALTWSGWILDRPGAPEAMEEVHESIASFALFVVVVHIVAVLASSVLHHENLIGAMFSGRKRGPADAGIRRAWWSVALLVLACVLAFWWYRWDRAPAPGAGSERESHVAFQHLGLQPRPRPALPQGGGVPHAVPERAAVRPLAARDRTGNAHELGAHLLGRQADLRVTVPAHVDEFQVRRQLRIG